MEGEAVKAFYRNELMRVPTRAREISFTFTPRRVYRPLWSGDGGADSKVPRRLCTRQAFALRRFLRAAAVTAWRKRSPLPRTDAFCRCRKSRGLARSPNLLFRSRRPPCRKGDNVDQKLRFRRARAEGYGVGEHSVHIGTTKD